MAERRLRSRAKLSVSGRSVARYFEALPDPRHHRNRRHLLGDVITNAVYGVIVGCDGPTAIRMWAKANRGVVAAVSGTGPWDPFA